MQFLHLFILQFHQQLLPPLQMNKLKLPNSIKIKQFQLQLLPLLPTLQFHQRLLPNLQMNKQKLLNLIKIKHFQLQLLPHPPTQQFHQQQRQPQHQNRLKQTYIKTKIYHHTWLDHQWTQLFQLQLPSQLKTMEDLLLIQMLNLYKIDKLMCHHILLNHHYTQQFHQLLPNQLKTTEDLQPIQMLDLLKRNRKFLMMIHHQIAQVIVKMRMIKN